MRTRPNGIDGHAQRHGISAAKIDQAEPFGDDHRHVDEGIEIIDAEHEHPGIAAAAVSDDRFEECNLEGPPGIGDAEPARRV
jgi:hypothetical protein